MRFVYAFIIMLLGCFQMNAQYNCAPFREWHYGEGTYYGGVAGSEGGNCGLPVPLGDTLHAAMNHSDYDSSAACGACVRVLGPKSEVILKIVDQCPECKAGDLDMTPAAFYQLAQAKDGRIKIAWQLVECPVADLCIKYKSGSSAFWSAIQLRNHSVPISKLEFRNSSGNFEAIHREMYNYFVKEDGIDAIKTQTPGPYFFRITAVTGQTIETAAVPFLKDGEVCIGQQFPAIKCPDCHGDSAGNAQIDLCGLCAGGKTGLEPNTGCTKDCNDYWDGTAYRDGCNRCVGGITGLTPCDRDCIGVLGGGAFVDRCGRCVGGTTGLRACVKQHFVLQQGPNLIAIGVQLFDSSIAQIFANLDIEVVKTQDRFWRKQQNSVLNSLQSMVPNMGYWVFANKPTNLTISGLSLDSASVPSYFFKPRISGWYLMGNSMLVSVPFSRYFNASNCLAIKSLDGFWLPDLKNAKMLNMEPNNAYFVKFR